jgi:FkbM family methyltransferase
VKRCALLLLPALLLAALITWFYPPLRHAALAAAGRGNGCPPASAWQITAHQRELTRVKDDILSKSRLLQKELNGLELYQTPYGPFWAPAGSRYILPFNFAEQAVQLYGPPSHYVRKGDVVLDCGANVGTFSRFALDAGARLVVAIEPAPDNVECLRRNFQKEIAEKRLVIYPKGVWDKEDTLELLVDPENQAADSFVIQRQGAKAVAKIPLTTIDRMAAELNLDRVDFIKMDIEGAEVKALLGAHSTLARFHPRMSLSVYHHPDHPVQVPAAARAAYPGYTLECGPCNALDSAVRPDVIYFR